MKPEEVDAPQESELAKGIKELKKIAGGKLSKMAKAAKK